MDTHWLSQRRLPALGRGLAVLLFAGLLLRAWPRLLHPEVWDEDGTVNLPGFLVNGLADLFQPVNGYLIVVPKIITALTASISLVQYPAISTVLAFAVTVGILLVVARAPLLLRGGPVLALLCLLIPSDAENFGLPLYTLWWTGVLLMAITLWAWDSRHVPARIVGIALASLSSPVCLVTLPLFWLRVLLAPRRRPELGIAVAATLFAGIQFAAMFPIQPGGALHPAAILQVIPVFLGSYAIGNLLPWATWTLGLGILAYAVFGLVRHRRSEALWMLGYLWVASVLMSITRVDIGIIHPVHAGPRYFFFPYILLGWFLLQLAWLERSRWARAPAIAFLLLSVANALPHLTRFHDPLHWKENALACAEFPAYALPVHFDGRAASAWSVTLSGATCADLLERDVFGKFSSAPSSPFRVLGTVPDADPAKPAADGPGDPRLAAAQFATVAAVRENQGFTGLDYYSAAAGGRPTAPRGLKILGSFRGSDVDQGTLTIRLRRGDRLLYRTDSRFGLQQVRIRGMEDRFRTSAPVRPQWTLLEFSHRQLPDSFDVVFSDGGAGYGEWTGVALRAEP